MFVNGGWSNSEMMPRICCLVGDITLFICHRIPASFVWRGGGHARGGLEPRTVPRAHRLNPLGSSAISFPELPGTIRMSFILSFRCFHQSRTLLRADDHCAIFNERHRVDALLSQRRSNPTRTHLTAYRITRIRVVRDCAIVVGSPDGAALPARWFARARCQRKTVTYLCEVLAAWRAVCPEIFRVGFSIWRDIAAPHVSPLPESRRSTRCFGYGQCSVGG